MTKYYIDTCIWIDLYENRIDKYRPLGEWAFEFFRQTQENKDTIIISNIVVKELDKKYNYKQIKELFEIVEDNLIHITASKVEFREGLNIANQKKISGFDGVHAVLAKNNNAILVSRDKHFFELSEIINVKKPEELI